MTKTQGAAVGLILAILIALLFIIWYQRKIIERQRRIETSMVEMRELRDGSVRNKAVYATEEQLRDFARETGISLKAIRADAKKLGADVKGISHIKVITPGIVRTEVASTGSTLRPEPVPTVTAECPDGTEVQCENPDKFGYLGKTETLKLEEPFANGKSVPWGEAGFSAWKKNPWDIKVKKRKYSAVTVMSQDEDGRHFTHSKFIIETDGKKYTVPVEAKLVEKLPESKFRFSPRLYLGVDAGSYIPIPKLEVTPNLQISLFSYGRTKISPRWTFLGLGFGFETQENRIALMVSPVNYNVGKHLPLVDNIYIGPSIGFDIAGNYSLYGGIRVGL